MRNSVNAADKLLQPNYSYASSLNLRLGKQKVHATFQAKQSCFFLWRKKMKIQRQVGANVAL